ncbi:sporulation histidine kinase inhibitor Sda [Virgibacillus sp. SK37]|uniref:sporulation histidine kinase inhibitor Sda n=1 Tax=Virgibacillus sp. SK37 TaxID=403957 RepID=UPI0004D17522|nr:sporulation histidine kinase inhibitor Sda [Virgibacillus sp. SK37]AIF42142.1 sporulation inhibitor sda [Virgibacillus sp. SK37]
MWRLTDELLVESYMRAKSLGLDKDFVALLEDELNHRNIFIQYIKMPSSSTKSFSI